MFVGKLNFFYLFYCRKIRKNVRKIKKIDNKKTTRKKKEEKFDLKLINYFYALQQPQNNLKIFKFLTNYNYK